MAEKKKSGSVERKIVPASEQKADSKVKAEASAKQTVVAVEPSGKSAVGFRIGAAILWVLAIAAEVVAICLLNGQLYIPGNLMTWLIVAIAVDLVLVIIGSQLWKKSNRIDPASEKNKLKFWLWNNLGVIVSVIAFFPLVFLLLKNKELDPKTKKIVSIIAAVALLVAGGASYDFDPVSAEDLEQAKVESTQLGDGSGTAYWTRWGKSYHFDPNCQTLLNSEVVYQGTVEEAFEANRTDPCDFCAGGGDSELAAG